MDLESIIHDLFSVMYIAPKHLATLNISLYQSHISLYMQWGSHLISLYRAHTDKAQGSLNLLVCF